MALPPLLPRQRGLRAGSRGWARPATGHSTPPRGPRGATRWTSHCNEEEQHWPCPSPGSHVHDESPKAFVLNRNPLRTLAARTPGLEWWAAQALSSRHTCPDSFVPRWLTSALEVAEAVSVPLPPQEGSLWPAGLPFGVSVAGIAAACRTLGAHGRACS